MAEIVKQGYLNEFVKPTGDGGWGLCEYIVSLMAENRIYKDEEIYNAIQNDGELSADVKALKQKEIEQVMNWMEGKTFSGVAIVKTDTITYAYVAP